MTVCVAAFAQNSKAIVMVSDKAITYSGSTPLQSDTGIKKVRRIAKTPWHVLIAGDPTFALKVIEICESHLVARKKKDGIDLASSAEGMMACMKASYQRARRELVEDTVLSPRMLTPKLLVERSKELQPLDPDLVTQLLNACGKANAETSLLVCGFDPDNHPHIFSVVNPGKIGNHDLTGFHAVGMGAKTALARLLMLDAQKRDHIALALYQAFDAKVNAEIVQSVGYSWDAEILVAGKSKNVPPHILTLIDNVYAAFPKDPYARRRYKYPRNWKRRLHLYLVGALEDKPKRSASRKSAGQR